MVKNRLADLAGMSNVDPFDDQGTVSIAEIVHHLIGIDIGALTPAVDAPAVLDERQPSRRHRGAERNVREAPLRGAQQLGPWRD